MLVGTYTKKTSKGVYRVDLDPATGKLSEPALSGEATNPSFLARHPTKPFLYAISEIGTFNGQKSGAVAAFSYDPATLRLTALNKQPSGGQGPCFVSVDASGKTVMVANYGSGSVASLPVNDDGSLGDIATRHQHEGTGPNKSRQEGPHAHSVRPAPGGKFALSADLGTDQILVYALTDNSTLTPAKPFKTEPGVGPRHIAFSPDGQFAFVANELSNSLTLLSWDGQAGVLQQKQTLSTLPDDYDKGGKVAEVVAHPSGKFVYVSNRGHDSIAVFGFDGTRLSARGHTPTQGAGPRNFNVSPDGKFLVVANEQGDNLVAYRIDAATGALTPTGSTVSLDAPVCVIFVP